MSLSDHAIAPEALAKLAQFGLVTYPPSAPKTPENPIKEGPKRPKAVKLQTAADVARKRQSIPPICIKSGCEAAAFHYCPATGYDEDQYGKFCEYHKIQAALKTREYKKNLEANIRRRESALTA